MGKSYLPHLIQCANFCTLAESLSVKIHKAPLRRLVRRQCSRRVTAFALLRSVLIEEHVLALELALLFVASGTGHVLMQPLQGELSALVVVEE